MKRRWGMITEISAQTDEKTVKNFHAQLKAICVLIMSRFS